MFDAPKMFLRMIELYDSSESVLFVSDFYLLLGWDFIGLHDTILVGNGQVDE